MAQSKTLGTTIDQRDDALIVALTGRLDSSVSDGFGKTLGDALNPDIKQLIINFDALTYISSAGLRSILIAGKQLHAMHGRMVLVGLHGLVQQVFETCGFLILFETAASVEAALAAQ
ncbi:STAS domain-containing protein [Paraburkholderia bonniea]|uniref:STAS domain-containing protein n=1 Tax=Paraburkholderia bonniea TaxID=2152891 RepID=UPI001290FE88|nr:STAS domain-containing protein [Paraburkholderia bonniea]WJF89322.1 STAS domain-containing protein [Paraburkholderia bonniea]WJF92638.1 STAS domain-containing protein [Paraburkholderia bonniea]